MMFLLTGVFAIGQKANSKSKTLTAQTISFPANERLSTKEYGFVLTESVACEGLILPRTISTPVAAIGKALTVFHITID